MGNEPSGEQLGKLCDSLREVFEEDDTPDVLSNRAADTIELLWKHYDRLRAELQQAKKEIGRLKTEVKSWMDGSQIQYGIAENLQQQLAQSQARNETLELAIDVVSKQNAGWTDAHRNNIEKMAKQDEEVDILQRRLDEAVDLLERIRQAPLDMYDKGIAAEITAFFVAASEESNHAK
jgi:chromosome segregation ATPase